MKDILRIDELNHSEDPAVLQLQQLGWSFVASEMLEAERESLREVILRGRLQNALKTLNPWLSDDNISRVIYGLKAIQAPSLAEKNEQLHTMLAYGVTVQQDIGDGLGLKSRTVKLIDFDNVRANTFIFTRQFQVQNAKGASIIPDIVLFINGIPLAVIECKSPKITNPMVKAIEQITRYQELEDRFEGLGAPKLFETIQVVASMCGVQAQYATVGAPKPFWAQWKVPYPLTLDEFQKQGGDTSAQSILIQGMFAHTSFLDLARNFIVFEVDGGRSIKKLARYQQFIAVNRAVERIRKKKGSERGGIVWHTQGSGKSLTMVYMALKLRRLPELLNPTIVIVTDRIDLDRQLSGTFTACGFPNPERASSTKNLKSLLSSHGGRTIMTTVQKFGGMEENLTFTDNVFVMVDEAHRTQYKSLAARMRLALGNACFLGFTGTPIDKKDRSTFATFGEYIHTYTIEEAVKDGATVPIYYESRMPELQVAGGDQMDEILKRLFPQASEDELEEIKRRFATEEAIAGSPQRVRLICLDLLKHFEQHIYPNGFKAQIVTANRETAVLYKKTLDSLGAPKSALIMSVGHNDPKEFRELAVPKDQHKTVIEDEFKDKHHPLAILVVCDMLLTGFDAPVEQVMYLDSPLKEHTLLQAIARVNRKASGKTYGLVVDYWGVSRNLQDALAIFNAEDVANALKPLSDELPRIESRHQAVLRFFSAVDRNNLEACLKILEPEDVRAEFDEAFKRFSSSLDMVLPDPKGLRFTGDLRWLADVRAAARNRFREETFDLSGCGEKVRKLIEEHIQTKGITELTGPVSIFSKEFDEAVEMLNSPEAKASEMEHAIRHEISIRLHENPVFYKSLRERLEQLIEARRQERIDTAEQLKLFSKLREDLVSLSSKAQSLGLSDDQFAFFTLFKSELGSDQSKDLAHAVVDVIKGLAVIDWQNKEDVQREMRRKTKQLLRIAGAADIEKKTNAVVELARARFSK